MQVDLTSWLDKLSLVKWFEEGPEARVTSQLDKCNLSSWLVKFHLRSNASVGPCRFLFALRKMGMGPARGRLPKDHSLSAGTEGSRSETILVRTRPACKYRVRHGRTQWVCGTHDWLGRADTYSQSHLGWHFRMLFQRSKLKARTVWTIDIGTNPSEPTTECGLGNRENPSEPTTPLPSPQYGKAEASEISGAFCWLNFSDFSSGATRYDWFKFSDFRISSQVPVSNLGEWRHICHFFRWPKNVTFWPRRYITFLKFSRPLFQKEEFEIWGCSFVSKKRTRFGSNFPPEWATNSSRSI